MVQTSESSAKQACLKVRPTQYVLIEGLGALKCFGAVNECGQEPGRTPFTPEALATPVGRTSLFPRVAAIAPSLPACCSWLKAGQYSHAN